MLRVWCPLGALRLTWQPHWKRTTLTFSSNDISVVREGREKQPHWMIPAKSVLGSVATADHQERGPSRVPFFFHADLSFSGESIFIFSCGGLIQWFRSCAFLSKLKEDMDDVWENVTYLLKVLFKLLPQLWTNNKVNTDQQVSLIL